MHLLLVLVLSLALGFYKQFAGACRRAAGVQLAITSAAKLQAKKVQVSAKGQGPTHRVAMMMPGQVQTAADAMHTLHMQYGGSHSPHDGPCRLLQCQQEPHSFPQTSPPSLKC